MVPIKTILGEDDADAIVYDEKNHTIYTANGDSHSITVIDAIKNEKTGSIPLAGKPEFAVFDGKDKLFVNIADKNEIVIIDTKANKVLSYIDVASACEEPTGLAIDTADNRFICRLP